MAMSMGTTPRRLVEADRELSEHFTAAVGPRAQSYEPAVTGGVSAPEVAIMSAQRSRERAQHAVVSAMLGELAPETRHVLVLVYAHGTDALSDATDAEGRAMAGKPTGLVAGKHNKPDPLGLLRVALSPTWGSGSYLRLAVGQYRALRAFGKRHPGRTPSLDAMLDYLAHEAGRGDASAGMLAELRNECESARDAALVAFSDVRGLCMARASKARQAAREVERERAETIRSKATAKRIRSERVPACLRMSDEQRERLRESALRLVAAVEAARAEDASDEQAEALS